LKEKNNLLHDEKVTLLELLDAERAARKAIQSELVMSQSSEVQSSELIKAQKKKIDQFIKSRKMIFVN